MDKIIIIKEIKKYLGFKKDCQLARHLGVTPQRFSNWKKRNSYNMKLLYTKCEFFNYEWLLTGKEPMLKKDFSELNKNSSLLEEADYSFQKNKKNYIPLYNLENNGGLKNILNKNSKQVIISDFIKIPDLADCDGAIYVKGDSMLPVIKSGDIIIFKNISKKEIFWGELYLVEIMMNNNTTHTLIRYVQKSDAGKNYIRLIAQDKTHFPQDILINKVNAIALIRGNIQLR